MEPDVGRIVRELEQLTTDLSSQEIVQTGVDIAQRATASRIAYLHFLNQDRNTIEFGAWSRDTLTSCTARFDRHYPVADAGIWADSARHRRPCVHNDYEHELLRHGLPAGHSRLIRHLGLPVVDDGQVRMLIGVGNKPSDYVDSDIEVLDLIARRVWSVLRQRRVLEHYLQMAARLRQMQQVVWVCGLDYDIEDDVLECDAMFANVFGLASGGDAPRTLAAFLAFVVEEDRAAAATALTSPATPFTSSRLWCRHANGTAFPAELVLEFRPREIGTGFVATGTLRDLSEQIAVDALRRRADTDPLTGLPNRNVLARLLENEEDRRTHGEGVAFHYIDLDGFKPVNDTYGHFLGDEVLRTVAERLRQSTRQADVVLRMGGDEFAVVQMGIDRPAAALRLADTIVAAISEPIVTHGHVVAVGASVGIAFSADGTAKLDDLSEDADRALYRAKHLGGHRSVIAGAWED